MFTAPTVNTSSHTDTHAVREADAQAGSELQGRFPGWAFLNGLYQANGDPYKAHIRDREGRIWTVWFGSGDEITDVVQGDQ